MQKNVLLPHRLEEAKSLATAFTSTITDIPYLDNLGVQINVTTTNSTGTFTIETSIDKVSWVTLPVGTISVAAATDQFFVNMNNLPFQSIRVKYVPTIAGTGVCDIYVMGKEV